MNMSDADHVDAGLEEAAAYHANASKGSMPGPGSFANSTAAGRPRLNAGHAAQSSERLKRGGAPHILAWCARSLAALEYDVVEHPSFHDYACGVMASSDHAPASVTEDKQLQRRFPPRPLSGLISGHIWLPPKEYERCRPSMKREGPADEK
jgi:hypothetical protein